ncbi:MAG: pyrroline-5-carboxylate reductase [Candidatus Nitrotoga sp.]
MKVCFVGGGNMATALIGGLLKQDFVAAQISVVEINVSHHANLHNEFGVQVVAGLEAGVAGSDVIVLAVKPQQLQGVATKLVGLLTGQLLISIAAGIRAADLAHWLGSKNIVRAMPNTPALIQSGVSGLYALPAVSQYHCDIAQTILAAVGTTIWLKDEKMMDAITAVSGSGPAYVFYFIEALQQAASELGFDAETSRHLATNTFIGAAKLADASNDDVSVLRARVTSKNGTTERALLSMETNAVKQHIVAAVQAAASRAREMGNEQGKASC